MKSVVLMTVLLVSGTVFAKNGKYYPMRESISVEVSATGDNACIDAQNEAAQTLIDLAEKYCERTGKIVNDDRPQGYPSDIGHGHGIMISHEFQNLYCGPSKTSLKSTIRFDCVKP